MKDGAIISNAGHFDIEIDVAGLRKMATSERTVRRNVEEFMLADGRRIRLLAEGRLVNLGAAEGHPAAVMDMSFAGQALTLHWLTEQHKAGKRLEPAVHNVPEDLDAQIASAQAGDDGRCGSTRSRPSRSRTSRAGRRGHRPSRDGSARSPSASRGSRCCADWSTGPTSGWPRASTEIKKIVARMDDPRFARRSRCGGVGSADGVCGVGAGLRQHSQPADRGRASDRRERW